MTVIEGKKYYTIDEAAALAGVNLRTLRRWLSAERLSDFLYPYHMEVEVKGKVKPALLYRLEPPDDTDIDNQDGTYRLPCMEGGVINEGN